MRGFNNQRLPKKTFSLKKFGIRKAKAKKKVGTVSDSVTVQNAAQNVGLPMIFVHHAYDYAKKRLIVPTPSKF